ncbi:MAG: serpin family protein [Clostridiales bacterium]|nr:serpin family protein [Clostridiales bacterium]
MNIGKRFRFFTCAILSAFLFASVSCAQNAPFASNNPSDSYSDSTDNGGNESIDGATALATPAPAYKLSYNDRKNEDYVAFKQKLELFSAKLASITYDTYDKEPNFTISPLSVFSALALAVEGADGATRTQILNALGVSYAQLQEYYAMLYNEVTVTHSETENGEEKLSGEVQLSNSVWMQEGVLFKQPTLDTLANKYYAYSYLADFKRNNEGANEALKDFVKKQTHGLIDQNFQLSKDTILALVNTLYLKDGWLQNGDDLQTAGTYTFTNADGSTLSTELLRGLYSSGRAYETDAYSFFYNTTANGYKVKFILPKDGYSVADIFTEETLSEVNSVKNFTAADDEYIYFTRCIFPEFTAEYDEDMKDLLKEYFSVLNLFDKYTCDFNNLIQNQEEQFEFVWCEKVQHVAKLSVDKTGIEGAAATVIQISGSTSAPDMPMLYADFVVDKAFGFIVTSPHDITLFSGVVENL